MPETDANEQPRSMVVEKPKSNVFTVLLGISAMALTLGCVLLLMEWAQYAGSFSPFALWGAASGP